MKRVFVLLVLTVLLLTACVSIDDADVPTAQKVPAPTEPWENTIPLPRDPEGNFMELD